jgi:cell wall-associated NlpC family hydrolase
MPAWCTQYVGLPFKDLGRDRGGLDCWGLVRLVLAEQFGITNLHDYSDRYTSDRDPAAADLVASERARWTAVTDPHPGDVAVFRVAGRPWHVGLVVAPGVMLTTARGTGAVLDRLDAFRWLGRLDGYYRHG